MSQYATNLSTLPPELHLLILKELIKAHNEPKSPRRGLATYASVCRGWQASFEPLIYRHFILRPNDLGSFREVTEESRRRRYVEHIWLRLDDPPLQVQYEMTKDSPGWSKQYFTNVIQHLWTTLAEWEAPDFDKKDQRRLTLEINSDRVFYPGPDPSPPDDLGHYSKYLESGSLEAYDDGERFYYTKSERDNMKPNTVRNLFGRGAIFDTKVALPEVRVVTDFLTRRGIARCVRPQLLGAALRSLVRLRHAKIERWRNGLVRPESQWLSDMQSVFWHLPCSLRKLAIFEERGTENPRFNLILKDEVVYAIMLGTQELERFSLCFLIDAEKLLGRFIEGDRRSSALGVEPEYPRDGYQKLTTLTLTPESFKANLVDDWDIESWLNHVKEVVKTAALAALRMPELRLLEVWNGGGGTASILRYEVRDDYMAELSWHSTQNCDPFDEGVEQTWRDVAERHGHQGLVASSSLLSGDFEYYSEAISHLHSRDLVLHPVSAVQMA
ncbi:hypothetical protein CTRI78_v004616 [Colletotrichum trifolii]|uniref:DUF6546 domain-containing protein n=1 Tax=Colletotrichum trifolii TaxID=5466 RepID=A0A4R8RK01_COLTR|nr:hypothetical protein CTRI78_v004616 [Colletotrichum trifolii]